MTDQAGEGAWPITAATFILMPREPKDPVAAAEALKFFEWAYAKGDEMATSLDYIPMPDKVVELVRKTWGSDIKTK